MAYNNYNNRNRYNGGHKKKYNYNYSNNYNNRPQNSRPANDGFNGFDATQYKKPNIEIKDLNGKVYTISGNFSTAFSAEIVQYQKQIETIQKVKNDVEKFPEIFNLLKEWCLKLLNLNIEGVECTMDDVNSGFNDIHVLKNLMVYIANIVKAERANMITDANS